MRRLGCRFRPSCISDQNRSAHRWGLERSRLPFVAATATTFHKTNARPSHRAVAQKKKPRSVRAVRGAKDGFGLVPQSIPNVANPTPAASARGARWAYFAGFLRGARRRRSARHGSTQRTGATKKVPAGASHAGTKVGVWEFCTLAQNSSAVGSQPDSWSNFLHRSPRRGAGARLTVPRSDG
jgi:hypothetical protein